MKPRKELILLSVISIVFLAGCTRGGGEATTGAGVIITSFAPDLESIDPGTSATFTVALKNIGSKAATDIKALLFGLSDEWDGVDVTTKKVKSTTTLASADPTTGLTGEETTFDWTATFPAGKGKNVDVTYDASVRVFYKYTTESDVLLRFVEANYLRTNPNVQKGVVSSESSSGPLVITAVARTPSVTATALTGRVQFEIQNVGAGKVTKGITATDANAQPDELDMLTEIRITGAKKCGSESVSSGIVTLKDQRLTAGKSKIISCEIDTTGITNFKDVALRLNATYYYFVDSATQVTVLRALQ